MPNINRQDYNCGVFIVKIFFLRFEIRRFLKFFSFLCKFIIHWLVYNLFFLRYLWLGQDSIFRNFQFFIQKFEIVMNFRNQTNKLNIIRIVIFDIIFIVFNLKIRYYARNSQKRIVIYTVQNIFICFLFLHFENWKKQI